ncbi:pollen-specific protein C13-like [Lolium rigidum]|uniref:pollen-specific protein C13-like n=1 Tax=Lolium rigidum TaxID=89674 RepID=UPI001F5C7CFB|nr:pollen-specific protein C13-like [Lolium rigidum]
MASLRAFLLLAAVLCALAASSVSATRDLRSRRTQFVVRGNVWCDTCRAGFETPASTYIAGAKVRVECKSKLTGAKTCSFEGHTDHTGTYNIPVDDEHEHEICESVLVSSPDMGCAKIVDGRERAPVFLNNNNGVTSNIRLANALGFQKDIPLAACAQILKMYEEVDDRV